MLNIHTQMSTGPDWSAWCVCVCVCERVCVCVCVVIKPAMFYWPADTVHKKISGPNPLVV